MHIKLSRISLFAVLPFAFLFVQGCHRATDSDPKQLTPTDVFWGFHQASLDGDKDSLLELIPPKNAHIVESIAVEDLKEQAGWEKNLALKGEAVFGDLAIAIKSTHSREIEKTLDLDPLFFHKIDGAWRIVLESGPPCERYFAEQDLSNAFDEAKGWYVETARQIREKLLNKETSSGLNSKVAVHEVASKFSLYQIRELGLTYHRFVATHGRAPSSAVDLKRTYPSCSMLKEIESGELTVVWDAAFEAGVQSDDYVLIYESSASETGGMVVMGSGYVQKLTAKEFADCELFPVKKRVETSAAEESP